MKRKQYVFTETGRRRRPKRGDWYIAGGSGDAVRFENWRWYDEEVVPPKESVDIYRLEIREVEVGEGEPCN